MRTDYRTAKLQKAALEFSIKNHCIISPDGWGRQLEGYIEHGHCLCDQGRPECPCAEAPQELTAKGRCLCGLFWSSYESYSLWKSMEEIEKSGCLSNLGKALLQDQPCPTRESRTELPKFEALPDFLPDKPSSSLVCQRDVRKVLSLFTRITGVELETGKRMIISRDKDGSLSVDIAQPLTKTKWVKEFTQEEETHSGNEASEKPHVIENDAEIALLLELNTDGEVQQLLLQRAMYRFPQILTQEELDRKTLGGQPIWQEWFFNCLLNLETKGHAAYSMRDLRWRITGNGLRRVALAREVERRSNSTGG